MKILINCLSDISSCWSCIFNWLESHNGAITAIASIFMAVFTYRLWVSTNRLWEAGEKQFISIHRPKIIVRSFRPNLGSVNADNTYLVELMYLNNGELDAHVIEVGTTVFFGPGPWNYGARKVRFKIEKIDKILSSGQEFTVLTQDGFSITEDTNTPVENAFQGLGVNACWYCIGYIRYTAKGHRIERTTGFCRKWNPPTRDWGREENEEYEYSY